MRFLASPFAPPATPLARHASMFPAAARTLSGHPDGPQHLIERHVGDEGLAIPAPASESADVHLLLVSFRTALTCRHGASRWLLPPGQCVWIAHHDSLAIRSASARPAELLLWHFRSSALPSPFHPLLPPSQAQPVHGPIPLTPSMDSLVLALRGCPVAPNLRNLWGTGKLIEFLSLILPAIARPEGGGERESPAPPPVVLHPAIRAALDYMVAHLEDPIGLPDVAAAANSSPSHLSRLFTAEFGQGPTQYLRRLRLERAGTLLRSGRANVTEAALAAGYASLGQFSRAFTAHHGRPPSAFIPRHS